MKTYTCTSTVWIYPSETTSWYFVEIPKEISEQIRVGKVKPKSFGVVKIEARIGKVVWHTALFFNSRTKTYIVPIKKSIRRQCGVQDGDTVCLVFKIL
ncbi:MAG: DUF1905 domain-containing protein [Candidatus Taylorbacteria bacterium]|nr:DUF1905 domain-containing protein [Candidatus Taylorbacteria bacterium]